MAKKPNRVPARPTVKPTPAKPGGRTEFGLVGNKNVEVYPFKEAVPKDFNFKTHKPLKKRDFTADYLFYEYRAAEMDFKAIGFRAQAEESKKLGSAKDRAQGRRLVRLQEKMSELRKQLTEQGINVDDLLKTAVEDEAE